MTDLMQREMQEIFYLFYGGLAVMMIFSVRDVILKRCQKYQRLSKFIYLMFWIFASFLFCQFLYRGAYGMITWYSLLAFALGMILWKKCFCDILIMNYTVHKYIGDNEDEKKEKGARRKVRSKKQQQ